MKTAWNYVLMFVSIPPVWLFHGPMLPGFGAGSNGSSPTDEKNSGGPGWPEPERERAKCARFPIICSGLGSSMIPAGTCSKHKEEKLEH
jgi:hypothetical protein